MEREEEEEEKVFVYSLAYSTLMDSSTTDQDEKTSVEEASTSGASSGSDSSPGSPAPLVHGEQMVEVGRNGITFTHVKHSPLFRTRLPHLSAHSLALSAGSRKQRYQSPYAPEGQYAQPQSYDKWSKQRGQNSKWTRRRRLERPLLCLASAILIVLLIAGIMIAIFWMPTSSRRGGRIDVVVPLNVTNITTSTTRGSRDRNISVSMTTPLPTTVTKMPTVTSSSTSVTATAKQTSSTTFPSTTTSTTTIQRPTTTQSTTQSTAQTTTQTIPKPSRLSITTSPPSSITVTVSQTRTMAAASANQTHTILTVSSTQQPPSQIPGGLNPNISPPMDTAAKRNSTERPP